MSEAPAQLGGGVPGRYRLFPFAAAGLPPGAVFLGDTLPAPREVVDARDPAWSYTVPSAPAQVALMVSGWSGTLGATIRRGGIAVDHWPDRWRSSRGRITVDSPPLSP